MDRTRIIALLVLFAALSVASMIAVYATHQLPTQELKTTTLASYQQKGSYDYRAKLKPNRIYNRSTLKPGEGTLYTAIVDHINITFHYELTCTLPANTTIEQYFVQTQLESVKWLTPKTFTSQEMQQMFQFSNTIDQNGEVLTTLSVKPSEIKQLANVIDQETGTSSSSTFNLNIKPQILTLARTDVGTINENFNPALKVEFDYGEPDYISMEGLQQTTLGKIERSETVFPQSTMNQRFVAYMMATTSLVALALTTRAYLRVKPPAIKSVEEVIAPHKELVIEVAGEPSYKGNEVKVPMNSLEDLIKLADGLEKPVFHLKKPAKTPNGKQTQLFYVLEGPTRYQYEAEVS